MSLPIVYVETTVIGYLTSQPSNDHIVRGHQEVTREFWSEAAQRFELLISELDIRACSAGDAHAARERLEAIEGLREVA